MKRKVLNPENVLWDMAVVGFIYLGIAGAIFGTASVAGELGPWEGTGNAEVKEDLITFGQIVGVAGLFPAAVGLFGWSLGKIGR